VTSWARRPESKKSASKAADTLTEPDSPPPAESGPVEQGEPAPPAATAKKPRRKYKWIIETVVIVAAAFVLALLIQQFVIKPFAIPSPSMEPTLVQGDRVLVNRLTYHFRSPERGDVIVFHPPGLDDSEPYIKRVVALAGDTVSVHDGQLWVNGVAQEEPFIKEHPILGEFAEVTISAGCIWAMGDNRNNSGDSRKFGEVDVHRIIGVAFAIYWPIGHWGGL
jgi:signal peptidase I